MRRAGEEMFFDDRLATVLRHRAAGENAARTQFRQLLDLLGNRKYGRDEALIAAAWLRLGALGEQIKPADRASMITEPGWRFRSPELAAHLAEDEPEVAAAALARVTLEDEDWTDLIPRLPIRARGFLRLRKDLPEGAVTVLERLGVSDRGLPVPDELVAEEVAEVAEADSPGISEDAPADEPVDLDSYLIEGDIDDAESDVDDAANDIEAQPMADDPEAPGEQPSDIAALVDRINKFQRARDGDVEDPDTSPRLPLDDDAAAQGTRIAGFGFATDAVGRVEWADPSVAPMVVGKRLIRQRQLGEAAASDAFSRAFAARQPVDTAPVELDGADAITGEWIVDAEPRFTRTGGRFQGYVGRFRRPGSDETENAAAREGDRVRQLLHELRTPVNALQGFAEVIQQQLFGPAPHEYRALAANIAGDAARILSGFDELERLARLESCALDLPAGTTDLAALARRMVGQLQPVLAPRMAGIETGSDFPDTLEAAIHPDEAEALLWRVLATLAGITSAGETLVLELGHEGAEIMLSCDLPERLRREEDIFSAEVRPGAKGPRTGLFGAGFSLRLAAAEATASNGSITRDENHIAISLPLAPRDNGSRAGGDDSKSGESEDSEPARSVAAKSG